MNDESKRRWRRRRRRLRRRLRRGAEILGALAFVAIVVYAMRGHDSGHKRAGAATTTVTTAPTVSGRADVKLTACVYDNLAATANLAITNHSAGEMNYVVTVFFLDKHLLNTANVTVDHLPGGKRAIQTAAAPLLAAPTTPLRCVLYSVKRFP